MDSEPPYFIWLSEMQRNVRPSEIIRILLCPPSDSVVDMVDMVKIILMKIELNELLRYFSHSINNTHIQLTGSCTMQ